MEHVLALLTPLNALVMRVILHTGMRVSDVLNLKTADLKPSGWYTEQKTGKRRRYGLPGPLLADIKAQAGLVWAFPGRLDASKHRTRQTIWRDVKRAQRALRMPENVGTHSARKIYAVDLMAKYGDIERVRKALNHDRAMTTAIYAMSDMLLERKLQARERRRRQGARGAERNGPPAATSPPGGRGPRPGQSTTRAAQPEPPRGGAPPTGDRGPGRAGGRGRPGHAE